jgi:anti-sigma factor RsiW
VTCQDIADFLGSYHDGTLSEAQRAVFEEHLGVCPDCIAYLHSYEMTIKLSKTAGAKAYHPQCANAPEDLIRAIIDARKRST